MTTLRALEPEDLALLYTIENEPENWSLGTPGGPFSKFALKQYLSLQPSDIFQTGSLRQVICSDGQPVGLIDLQNYAATDRKAEIGIALLRSARHKGIASRALQLTEQMARDILNLRMLYAQVPLGCNMPSHNLFTQNGYRRVARLPEWHYANDKYQDILVYQKKIKKRQ